MSRLSVESTPIGIVTRAPIQEASPLPMVNQTSDIIGRERFFKTPEERSRIIEATRLDERRPLSAAINNLPYRARRPSRCDGVHDAEADPCGSPKCRTRGRKKLKITSSNQDQHQNAKPSPVRRKRIISTSPITKVA